MDGGKRRIVGKGREIMQDRGEEREGREREKGRDSGGRGKRDIKGMS